MKKWNNILTNICLLSVFLILFSVNSYSQDDTEETDRPVRSPWTTGILIDNQTTSTPTANAFEFRIYHRFGLIKDISDLFGIYAASNIMLGVNYGVTDKLMLGFGTEKFNKMQEFQLKYNILSQMRSGKIPFALTYFGNAVINASNKDFFGKDYTFSKRLSYFHQLMVSRKFSGKLTLQTAISYSHFNAVDSLWLNDYMGAFIGGRYKFHNKMSAIVEYTYPFAIQHAAYYMNVPKPNLGLGIEVGTSTHAFQIFAAQYNGIVPQENLAHNLNDISAGDWHFGFNITVRF